MRSVAGEGESIGTPGLSVSIESQWLWATPQVRIVPEVS
jgi:hypothetical protein